MFKIGDKVKVISRTGNRNSLLKSLKIISKE